MEAVDITLGDIVKTVQDLSEKRDAATLVDHQNALKAIGFMAQNAREDRKQRKAKERVGGSGKRAASKRDLPPLRDDVARTFPKVTQSNLTRLVGELSAGGLSRELYDLYRHMGYDGINIAGNSYYRNLTENDGRRENDKDFDRRRTKLEWVRLVYDRLKPYDIDAQSVASYVGYVLTKSCGREAKPAFEEAYRAVKRSVGVDIAEYERVDDAIVAYQKGLFENNDRFKKQKSTPVQQPRQPSPESQADDMSYESTSSDSEAEAEPAPKRPKK